MSNSFQRSVLLLLLAGVGYLIGLRIPLFSKGAAIPAETSVVTNSDVSKPAARNEADFSERLPRLRELTSKTWNLKSQIEGRRPGQDLLELETIFALATRDDLIAWFAEDGTAEAGSAALEAAYARLASLSLDDAIGIWTDQFRRTKKIDGVSGLVRAWAEMDPTGAEAWMMHLTDTKSRNAARFALLDTVLETSPDLVERHLVEHGLTVGSFQIFESTSLVSRLAKVVAPEKLVILADRFLAEKRGNWEYQNQLTALLKVWGERDTPAMMAWLLAQPPGQFQDHLVPQLVRELAEKDPAAFLSQIAPSLAGNETMAKMAGQAWVKWLAKDSGSEAMRWFQTHGASMKLDESMLWRDRSWSSGEAQRVLDLLTDLPDDENRRVLSKAALNQLSEVDPKVALERASALLPAGHDTDLFIASTLSNLAGKGDPSGALAWAVENLKDGQGKNDAVRFVMSSWADSNPLEAAEHARNLPEKLRAEAYSGIAYRWAERAPGQFLEYLEKASEPASVAPLARHAFWKMGYDHGGENFVSKALALPNDTMRKQAIEGLFGGWSQANLESSATALDTMERGELRDLAVVQFVENARWADREAAMTWAFEVSDAAKQRATVLDQGRRWLNADREAATKWIQSSATLPEEWREELLKARK